MSEGTIELVPVASVEVDAGVDGRVKLVFFGVGLDHVLNGEQLLTPTGEVERICRRSNVVDERRLEVNVQGWAVPQHVVAFITVCIRAGTGIGPGLNLSQYLIWPVPKKARAFIFITKAQV